MIHKDDEFIYDALPTQPAWIGIPREQWAALGFNFETPPKADGYWEDGQKYQVGELEFEIIHCPGHTPGHQSIQVDTTAGPALFTGDACWTVGQFDGRPPPEGTMEDPPAFERSLAKLRATHPAAVHFCHDKRTWHQPRVQV